MNRLLVICAMTWLVLQFLPGAFAQSEEEVRMGFMKDQLVLKLSDDLSEAEQLRVLKRFDLEPIYRYPLIRAWFVSTPEGSDLDALLLELQSSRTARWAQKNFLGHRGQTTPNDASFTSAWGLNNTGQTVSGDPGTNDADIDAPEAWDLATDATGVVLAIVDSGARLTHQDLAANLWSNPGEIAGNGIDDDGNGFVDDVVGWDFLGNDAQPTDNDGHGTTVTGTACARGNNGVGACGVCWTANAMILKDGDTNPQVALSAMCFEYAAMNGASVANFSTGYGSTPQPVLQAAVNVAQANGLIICVAAGNSSTNLNNVPDVPGTYTNPNLIVVAASTNDDGLANFSSFGATHVDVAAPGVNVYTTSRSSNASYSFVDGTSFAAPMTAGLVTLMRAYNPQASVAAIKTALISSCDPKPAFNGLVASDGRINAAAALAALGNGGPAAPVADFSANVTSGIVPLVVNFSDESTGTFNSQTWNFGDGQGSTLLNPQHTYSVPGVYNVIHVVVGPGGSDVEAKVAFIEVLPAPASGIGAGSFESFSANSAPASPWASPNGGDALVFPTGSPTSDLGFPSEGSQWARVLAGASDDAAAPSATSGFATASSGAAGLTQVFRSDSGGGILSLDVAFLNAELPNQTTFNDFLVIEVSAQGFTWIAHYRDTLSATPVTSGIGGLNSTGLETVQVDLGMIFPLATSATDFQLSVLVGNAGDDTVDSGFYLDRVELNEAQLFYPGTMGDLRLLTGIGTGPLTTGPGGDVTEVQPGDLVRIRIESPGGTFQGEPYSLLATGVGHTQGFSIPQVVFGGTSGPLPGLYADANTIVPVGGGNYGQPGGIPLLPGAGITFNYIWPVTFGGTDILLQAVANTSISQNGFFESSNGQILEEL